MSQTQSIYTELTKLTVESLSYTQGHLAIERQNKPLLKRLSHIVLVGAVKKYSKAWRDMYSCLMLESGYSLFACGTEQSVAIDTTKPFPSKVIKIDRPSLTMDADAKEKRLEKRKTLFDIASNYLGKFFVPQTVTIGPAPLKNRPLAIITAQSKVEPVVSDVVYSETRHVRQQLQRAGIPTDIVINELQEFIGLSRAMHKHEGLLPDVGGMGNLVIDSTGHLICVDSYVTDQAFRNNRSLLPGFHTTEEEHQAKMTRLQQLSSQLA